MYQNKGRRFIIS